LKSLLFNNETRCPAFENEDNLIQITQDIKLSFIVWLLLLKIRIKVAKRLVTKNAYMKE